MSRILILTFLFSIVSYGLFSQESDTARKGIHEEENEFYDDLYPRGESVFGKSLITPAPLNTLIQRRLTRKVLGWHPYWAASNAYLSYDYDALSHIACFSYEVDTATGGYTTIRDWNTTPVIDYAHQRGTKVLLTVTNFGAAKNTRILSDSLLQKNMFNTIIILLKSRSGDGVNFDLETVSSSQRANLVSFMKRAVRIIKAELPSAEISMATPAVDWSGSWDLKALSGLCDYLIVMGYNYFWSTSTTAGPVAPLEGESYNVSRTVNTYLAAGVAPQKLLLGVPWYGYNWPVVNDYRKSPATGSGSSVTFTAADKLATTYGRRFDQPASVPWIGYLSSSLWRQVWYDDPESLGMKYNLVRSLNLGGIGIWALSYEGGDTRMWNSIKTAFSTPEGAAPFTVKVYPNPVSSSLKIEYFLVEKSNICVDIIDISGRKLMQPVNEEREAGLYVDEPNVSAFANGIYLCRVRTGKSVITSYFVIAR